MRIKKEKSPNYSGREGNQVDMIIIHSASLPEGEFGTGYIADLFLNRLDLNAHPYFKEIKDLKVSAHFLIERGGEITQFVDTDDKAWHAGVSSYAGRENLNLYSIGIELEGDINTEFTDAQYRALIWLMKKLVKKYKRITKENVVRHSDVAPDRKKDPGSFFDMDLVKRSVFS